MTPAGIVARYSSDNGNYPESIASSAINASSKSRDYNIRTAACSTKSTPRFLENATS